MKEQQYQILKDTRALGTSLLIIPEFPLLVLTKRYVGSGNEIATTFFFRKNLAFADAKSMTSCLNYTANSTELAVWILRIAVAGVFVISSTCLSRENTYRKKKKKKKKKTLRVLSFPGIVILRNFSCNCVATKSRDTL